MNQSPIERYSYQQATYNPGAAWQAPQSSNSYGWNSQDEDVPLFSGEDSGTPQQPDGVMSQLDQAIQPAAANAPNLGIGNNVPSTSGVDAQVGNAQSMASSGMSGITSAGNDGGPGQSINNQVQQIQQEVNQMGMQAMQVGESGQLSAVSSSLGQAGQLGQQASKTHSEGTQKMVMGGMMIVAAMFMKTIAKGMQAAGMALQEAATAAMAIPFVGWIIAAALRAAGIALQLAGKALEVASVIKDAIGSKIKQLAGKLLGNSMKLEAQASKSLQATSQKLGQVEMNISKKVAAKEAEAATKTAAEKAASTAATEEAVSTTAAGEAASTTAAEEATSTTAAGETASTTATEEAASTSTAATEETAAKQSVAAAAKEDATVEKAASTTATSAPRWSWKKKAAVGVGIGAAGYAAMSMMGGKSSGSAASAAGNSSVNIPPLKEYDPELDAKLRQLGPQLQNFDNQYQYFLNPRQNGNYGYA